MADAPTSVAALSKKDKAARGQPRPWISWLLGGEVVLPLRLVLVLSLAFLAQSFALFFLSPHSWLCQCPPSPPDSSSNLAGALLHNTVHNGSPSAAPEASSNAPAPPILGTYMGRLSAIRAEARKRRNWGIFHNSQGTEPGTLKRSHLYGMDEELLPRDFVPFFRLLSRSGSDKREHGYGLMYSEYLDPMRLQKDEVNLLEIGLQQGDSLKLWLEAFPRGKIYGMDHKPLDTHPLRNIGQTELDSPRFKIFHGDQENVTDLAAVMSTIQSEVGLLDFIVDDGGHTMGQQLTSYKHLLPLVKPGGVYFIEDLQTSYWAKKCHVQFDGTPYCYGGGPPGAKNTTIDHIKSLLDVLNADYMEDHENLGVVGSGHYRVHEVDDLVGSVQCWRNMCALRRKYEDSSF